MKKGSKHTQETLEKIRTGRRNGAWSGLRSSEETRRKISMANKGKVPWAKGRKFTPEHIEKIAQANRGKKRTPEQIERMRISRIGVKTGPPSEEHRKKIGDANRGAKNAMWKGGVTSLYKTIRKSREYQDWRTAVFERDGYSCVWCGLKPGMGKRVDLQADHIKPFAHYPELRFAIDNGRTLCVPCHKTTDTYGGRSIKKLSL